MVFYQIFIIATVIDYLGLLHLVNILLTKYRYKFINKQVDARFRKILEGFKSDIVHFDYLKHLSLSLSCIVYQLSIPSVFTLHDFWLIYPRERCIQYNSRETPSLCGGQENKRNVPRNVIVVILQVMRDYQSLIYPIGKIGLQIE